MVDALIVNSARRGPMQIMGLDAAGATPSVFDALTGGEYSRIQQQLDRLELALQVTIVASCIAGVAGLVSLLWPRR
jgi:hypothetical protein